MQPARWWRIGDAGDIEEYWTSRVGRPEALAAVAIQMRNRREVRVEARLEVARRDRAVVVCCWSCGDRAPRLVDTPRVQAMIAASAAQAIGRP